MPGDYWRRRLALKLPQSEVLASALAKCSAVLDLRASLQSGGEWTPSIVDSRNSNPVTQTDADRRAAVGAAANGLPTAVFDGTDVHVWPLIAAINSATVQSFLFFYKPATVSGVQRLLTIGLATGGASAEQFQLYANNDTIRAELYATNSTGRVLTSGAATLTAGAWHAICPQYDSAVGGDGCYSLHVNAAAKSLSGTNIGAGATLGTRPTPTGNALIGGFNNQDAVTQPIANGGEIGTLWYASNQIWTQLEIAALGRWLVPT